LLVDRRKEHWKRRLLDRWVAFDNFNTHTLRMHLALAGLLGVPQLSALTVSWTDDEGRQVDALLGASTAPPVAVMLSATGLRSWATGWRSPAAVILQRSST
jgi:hypothetical protein